MEEAIFTLIDVDLSNALRSLIPKTNRKIYNNLLNKRLSKKLRRKVGRMIRKTRRD